MINIRRNTFETNSSSTHSLSILTEDEFDKWRDNKFLLEEGSDKLYTREQVESELYGYQSYEEWKGNYLEDEGLEESDFSSEEELRDDVFEYALREDGSYKTYYNTLGDGQDQYETFEQHYTTPNGDKIVAFGYYGQDY